MRNAPSTLRTPRTGGAILAHGTFGHWPQFKILDHYVLCWPQLELGYFGQGALASTVSDFGSLYVLAFLTGTGVEKVCGANFWATNGLVHRIGDTPGMRAGTWLRTGPADRIPQPLLPLTKVGGSQRLCNTWFLNSNLQMCVSLFEYKKMYNTYSKTRPCLSKSISSLFHKWLLYLSFRTSIPLKHFGTILRCLFHRTLNLKKGSHLGFAIMSTKCCLLPNLAESMILICSR